MKRVYPDYYPRFRCIAEKCRHNCCIGWEIDIDYATLNRYRRMKGPMGDRLRAHLQDRGTGGSFILDEEERCPLLNGQGLCDLILEKGERALCQICRDHPRFCLQLTGLQEWGLGLCCEAACRLILDAQQPVGLFLEDDGRSKAQLNRMETQLLERRNELITLAQDRSKPVTSRMDDILRKMEVPPSVSLAPERWIARYSPLESMDEGWDERLRGAARQTAHNGLTELQKEQLLVYFLYRHVLDGFKNSDFFIGCVMFCVLSVKMIDWLCAAPQDAYEVARQYSAEIEYSDENPDLLMETLEKEREDNR